MFLQALTEHARHHLRAQLEGAAWQEKPVPFLIELKPNGHFLGITERISSAVHGEKTVTFPRPLLVPRSPVIRTCAPEPLLGADDIKYVLGPGPWSLKGKQANHQRWHQAFVDLICEAALATQNPSLQACESFYNRPDQVARAREAMPTHPQAHIVALSVGGPIVADPRVREYWNEHYRRVWAKRVAKGEVGECLVCGEVRPILLTHDRILRIAQIGGQATGGRLISFDKAAFRSYGWMQSANSPLCAECSQAYVIALNHLLLPAHGHRKDIGKLGLIFWLKGSAGFNFFDLLSRPSWKDVKKSLTGDGGAKAETDTFYLLLVTGNASRLRVVSWSSGPLDSLRHNLEEWFAELGKGADDPLSDPLPFWRLLYEINEKSEPPAHFTIALLRRAVEGRARPLGVEFLAAVLRQNSHPVRPNRERIALIRLGTNDLIRAHQRPEGEMKEALDPDQRNRGYLAGRLFAEYEWLHSSFARASDHPDMGLLDDYLYALASTSPVIALKKLDAIGKTYFRTTRRANRGAATAMEQRIQHLGRLFEGACGSNLPSLLALEDQAWFALGYYHQRQYSFAVAIETKRRNNEARETNNT